MSEMNRTEAARSAAGKDGQRLGFWTVGKKIVVVMAIGVGLGFAVVIAIQGMGESTRQHSLAARANLELTALLAAQIGGGIRFRKNGTIEEAYSRLVQDERSTVAWIQTFDKEGALLTRYESNRIYGGESGQRNSLVSKVLSADKILERRSDDFQLVAAPVRFGANRDVVGAIVVGWSFADLNKTIAANILTQLLWAVLLSATLGAALVLTTWRLFTGPIKRIERNMKRLAEGDHAVSIIGTDRMDEIGSMARAVEVFRDNAIDKQRLELENAEHQKTAEAEKRQTLRTLADDFERSVMTVVDAVSTSASEMRGAAETMSATATQTNQKAGAVASASQRASDNVQTVAASAEELSASITEIARQVTQSTQISDKAVATAAEANKDVKGLAEAGQKIDEIVALINAIADQTNLLALNATIEAARAGEAGKGFAVVASEVKNLATQTGKETDEIAGQIAGIQSATQNAVRAIDSIGDIINEISDISTTVSAAVEEQGTATQAIAGNVQAAATGTEEVNTHIRDVTQATERNGEAAQTVLDGSENLSGQSDSLRREVENFLGQVRDS
jgi:methyl-accepting chemotaxis protein